MSATQVLKKVVVNGNRYYQSPNDPSKLFPSVTTVLGSALPKPGLSNWQRKFCLDSFKKKLVTSSATYRTPDIGDVKILPKDNILQILSDEAMGAPEGLRDQSAGFGTQAHTLIEDIITTGIEDVPCSVELEPTRKAFIAWKKAVEASGSKVIKTEMEVWSEEYGYAGTMDAVLETIVPKTGERILTALDWKTSNAIRNEYALQVAAYAKAFEERTGEKISKAVVVRFGRRSETYEARAVNDLEKSFDVFCSALHLFHSLNKPLL